MKFIVTNTTVTTLTKYIYKIASASAMVPILENLLFSLDANENKATVTASDLHISGKVVFDVEVDQSFSFCVQSNKLFELLNSLSEQPITFQHNSEKQKLAIRSDNGSYNLPTESGEDFPTPQINNMSFIGEVLTKEMKPLLGKVGFCASDDDQFRQALTGIYFHNDAQTLVTTNGHRLAKCKLPQFKDSQNFILPAKATSYLEKMDGYMKFWGNDTSIAVESKDVTYYIRLIDEEYPEYQNVIPDKFDIKAQVKREDLQWVLKRVVMFSNTTTNQIRCDFGKDVLHVDAENVDMSEEASEKIGVTLEGEPIEIGFNAKFLLDMVNHLEEEYINFHLISPDKATIIEDGNNYSYLLMPVMLKTEV